MTNQNIPKSEFNTLLELVAQMNHNSILWSGNSIVIEELGRVFHQEYNRTKTTFINIPNKPLICNTKKHYELAVEKYGRKKLQLIIEGDTDAANALIKPVLDKSYIYPKDRWQHINKGKISKKQRRK